MVEEGKELELLPVVEDLGLGSGSGDGENALRKGSPPPRAPDLAGLPPLGAGFSLGGGVWGVRTDDGVGVLDNEAAETRSEVLSFLPGPCADVDSCCCSCCFAVVAVEMIC